MISIAQIFEEIGEQLKFPQLPCIDLQTGKNGQHLFRLRRLSYMRDNFTAVKYRLICTGE